MTTSGVQEVDLDYIKVYKGLVPKDKCFSEQGYSYSDQEAFEFLRFPLHSSLQVVTVTLGIDGHER